MMSSICLDNVYMNYLQKKSEQKAKKKKKTKSNRPSKGRDESSSINAKVSVQPEELSSRRFTKSVSLGEKCENGKVDNDSHSEAQAHNNNKNMNKNNDELLLRLMQKNIKEGEFTPEQKSLHEAYDVLMAEYQRRKDQRQKVGVLFRKNKRNLRDTLKNAMAMRGKSDLALKAKSHDLQRQKIENKKKRITSFAAIVDADKI